ncbi:unnamed protein product, partial [Onchocerca ochengi]|uniref:GCV_T domain-containing protein n=1 Tax=Onchocerca ochengi TaxID=42157 RepID=A0A182EZ13_ONCOC
MDSPIHMFHDQSSTPELADNLTAECTQANCGSARLSKIDLERQCHSISSGGVCEGIIGLTKEGMRKAIGRKLFQERGLLILTTEIEGILNTRSITYVNFDDYAAIRPSDFISPGV